ncbi:MAG: SLT domain-containing protein [Verrucomicrobiales bacterium]|jgi:SLT domain-containing protein
MLLGRFSVGTPAGGDEQGEAEGSGYRLLQSARGTASSSGDGDGSSASQNKARARVDPKRLFDIFNTADGNTATVGFYEALRGMSSGQISEMLTNVETFPNHARRRETRERLIDYLTMIDPLKALEIRESLPGKGILGKAFKQLGRNGLSEAVRIAGEMEDSGDRRDALISAYVGASEVDPIGAFATLKTLPGVTASHYHEVFDNWAETDPEGAAIAALTVESAAHRRSALKIVGEEWAESDPQGALDWAKSAKLSSFERENIRSSAIKGITRRDPASALELLSTLDDSTRSRHLPDTIQALARKDPQAALAWIEQEPPGYAKNRAIKEAISSLADKAPEETLQLARDYPELKDSVLGSAFQNLARNDLPNALEKLKEWEGDSQYANALQSVAYTYSREDPDGALKWAMELSGDQKPSVLRSILSSMANDDPLMAAGHLEKLANPDNQSHHDSAVSSIASTWSRKDPVAAAEWLETFPDSNARNNGLRQVADRWSDVDPVSASEWIAGLPEGAARDSATQSLINNLRNDDPEMAIAWAENLSEPSNRDQSLYQVYSEWLNHDRNSALESIASSPLSDEMKRNLIPELQQQYQEQPQF